MEMARGIIASNWWDLRSDSGKESRLQKCASNMFDEKPSSDLGEWRSPNRILEVTIRKVCYPITESLLRQVFGRFGVVEQVHLTGGLAQVLARVVFSSKHEAAEAFGELHGRNIYDGCCQMDIEWGTSQEPVISMVTRDGDRVKHSSSAQFYSATAASTLDETDHKKLSMEADASVAQIEATALAPAASSHIIADPLCAVLDVMEHEVDDELLESVVATIAKESVTGPEFVPIASSIDCSMPSDINIEVATTCLISFPNPNIGIPAHVDGTGAVLSPPQLEIPTLLFLPPSSSLLSHANQSAHDSSDEMPLSRKWAEQPPWPPPAHHALQCVHVELIGSQEYIIVGFQLTEWEFQSKIARKIRCSSEISQSSGDKFIYSPPVLITALQGPTVCAAKLLLVSTGLWSFNGNAIPKEAQLLIFQIEMRGASFCSYQAKVHSQWKQQPRVWLIPVLVTELLIPWDQGLHRMLSTWALLEKNDFFTAQRVWCTAQFSHMQQDHVTYVDVTPWLDCNLTSVFLLGKYLVAACLLRPGLDWNITSGLELLPWSPPQIPNTNASSGFLQMSAIASQLNVHKLNVAALLHCLAKSICQQPWPPPVQLKVICFRPDLRPSPWLSFTLAEGLTTQWCYYKLLGPPCTLSTCQYFRSLFLGVVSLEHMVMIYIDPQSLVFSVTFLTEVQWKCDGICADALTTIYAGMALNPEFEHVLSVSDTPIAALFISHTEPLQGCWKLSVIHFGAKDSAQLLQQRSSQLSNTCHLLGSDGSSTFSIGRFIYSELLGVVAFLAQSCDVQVARNSFRLLSDMRISVLLLVMTTTDLLMPWNPGGTFILWIKQSSYLHWNFRTHTRKCKGIVTQHLNFLFDLSIPRQNNMEIMKLQVPWDPGGLEHQHRLEGKPKLKGEGMSGPMSRNVPMVWVVPSTGLAQAGPCRYQYKKQVYVPGRGIDEEIFRNQTPSTVLLLPQVALHVSPASFSRIF